MDGYIKKSEAVDVIVKYPYEIAGKTATAIKMIEDLPSADVVPKSEIESIITLNSQLEAKVFEQRKEIEKLTVELDAMRGVANSYKMHYEKAMEVQKEVYRLASEIKAELPLANAELAKNVASEIFAEIENIFTERIAFYEEMKKRSLLFHEITYAETMITNLTIYLQDIAELKKKYTEIEVEN